uniref:Uncharacterized protein n=1 Tax=Timspurckia oligopyrenoides TaxID=708627 RepID=A0A6T6ND31_9RHOD|mmetsp:Transcript_2773/g.4875  ORF Transcript_2773/g.4875 Transcript_2773/m.4875 type:complete len:331 (+) Transcript_2773:1242-2234(+)
MEAFVSAPRGASVDLLEKTRWVCGPYQRRYFVVTSRRCKSELYMKMRDWGGFRGPPKIPEEESEIRRSVELLGVCTQRRPSTKVGKELENLVGGVPKEKLQAQQWKLVLQNRVLRGMKEQKMREQGKSHEVEMARRIRSRRGLVNRMLDAVQLPESDEKCSFIFSLLDVQLRNAGFLTPDQEESYRTYISVVPRSMREIVLVRNALSKKQLARRRREKNPPNMPETEVRRVFTKKLLGRVAARGTVGRKTAFLTEILGAFPRNKAVARAWMKRIEHARYMQKKNEKRAAKKALVESIRAARAAKRRERELQSQATDTANTTTRSSDEPAI